jgi:hypothetical protein
MDPHSHYQIFRADERRRDAENERIRAARERLGDQPSSPKLRARVRRARRPRRVHPVVPPRFA